MAHQYMPKIFHDHHKNPPAPTLTYLMHGPLGSHILKNKVMKKTKRRSVINIRTAATAFC